MGFLTAKYTKMKTAEQWSEELCGETSPQAIRRILADAVLHAALLLVPENPKTRWVNGSVRMACQQILLEESAVIAAGQ